LALVRGTRSGNDRLGTRVQGLSRAACGVAQALLPVFNVWKASALVTGKSACATTPGGAPALDGQAKAAPYTRPDDEPPKCSGEFTSPYGGVSLPRKWRGKPAATKEALDREITAWGRGCKAYHGRHAASATPPIRAPALDGYAKAAPYTGPDDVPRTRPRYAQLPTPRFCRESA